MRLNNPFYQWRLSALIVVTVALATGCRSKLSTPGESASPTPGATEDTPSETPDIAVRVPDKKPGDLAKQEPEDAPGPIPSAPSETPEESDEDGKPPTTASKPYKPGLVTYSDKNIPRPPGAAYYIKNLQISESPVGEVGVGTHYQLRGGIYLSR